jgi:hypothetical protein
MNTGDRKTVRWATPATTDPFTGDTGANNTSEWIHIKNRNIGLQLIWTGTTQGAFTFQLSMDQTNVAVTLANTDFAPNLTNPAGAAANTGGQVATDFTYMRIVFTRAAGDGTLVGYVVGKE